MNKKTYVYGPVPSRRLGLSLGVDLVPLKTCNYNCVYCQLGVTHEKIMERKEYIPPEDILRDIREKIDSGVKADHISLCGSGEPTLHSGIGDILSEIKKMTNIPIAVITNGSLFHLAQVRKDCLKADLVLPSLDAGDASTFSHVNRPHPDIDFQQMVEGLIQFRKEYKGKIWLEVFLLGGITGIEAEVLKIKSYTDKIKPDKIQINTVTRPPAEDYVHKIDPAQLEKFRALLGNHAEIIADFSSSSSPQSLIKDGFGTTSSKEKHMKVKKEDILTLISRRPCTIDDMIQGLHAAPADVTQHIKILLSENRIREDYHSGMTFYSCKK